MKKQNRFPPGWNNARVQRLLDHYEAQSDIDIQPPGYAPRLLDVCRVLIETVESQRVGSRFGVSRPITEIVASASRTIRHWGREVPSAGPPFTISVLMVDF